MINRRLIEARGRYIVDRMNDGHIPVPGESASFVIEDLEQWMSDLRALTDCLRTFYVQGK